MQENYTTEQDISPVSLQKQQETTVAQNTKFCKHCGGKIPSDAVLCTLCGRQVEEISQPVAAQPQIIINNDNINTNTNTNMVGVPGMRQKNKWVAVLLCLFLGVFGVHRFYEGKIGTGLLYLFTFGISGVGVLIDLIILLFKPNPYYV
ncbi:MAG: TM2 domain-containing protein [Ruminococcus sp.]|nr:TM2 domain-containing protein [Ruminococcus sp.]MCM1382660.1 TM2 domain-containing protein [Muribaculaceae bacterium]MCM1478603.1 TM2 domain-containing protein [Muribaculaceae bacterium]